MTELKFMQDVFSFQFHGKNKFVFLSFFCRGNRKFCFQFEVKTHNEVIIGATYKI